MFEVLRTLRVGVRGATSDCSRTKNVNLLRKTANPAKFSLFFALGTAILTLGIAIFKHEIVIPSFGIAILSHGITIPCHGIADTRLGIAIPNPGIRIPKGKIAIPRPRIAVPKLKLAILKASCGLSMS